MITISIVNHDHDEELSNLLNDLINISNISKIILINNLKSNLKMPSELISKTIVINNKEKKGYAFNHNNAFKYCNTEYFCILNPDIRIQDDPFPSLISNFKDQQVALVAPAVLNKSGKIEDNARKYPSLFYLFTRKIGYINDTYNYKLGDDKLNVDWIAGMFLLLRSESFNRVGKLDDLNFFMYCEDIDLSLRYKKNGMKVILDPTVDIIHNAQRKSRKNLKFFLYHLNSMLKFFLKHRFNYK